MAISLNKSNNDGINGTSAGVEHPGEQQVIIIGAGITGLLVAHGLRRAGISFSVWEAVADLDDSRSGDWNLGIHWALPMLEEILGAEIYSEIRECLPDPSRAPPEKFLIPILNGETGDVLKLVPYEAMYRITREKFRQWLVRKLPAGSVKCDKKLVAIHEQAEDRVIASFADGTEVIGTCLIGADGPRSRVRQLLVGEEKAAPSSVPYAAKRIIVQYPTAEQALKVCSLHPEVAVAIHPEGIWSAIAVIDVPDQNAPETWKFQLMTSWPKSDHHSEGLSDVQARTQKFAEPFKSANDWIPEGTKIYSNRLTYWEPIPWDNRRGRITLAGDACHPMTFHRGQGVNLAIADVADYIAALKAVRLGETSLADAMARFEKEMIRRGGDEVSQSKMNTEMLHDWDKLKQAPVMQKGAVRG